MDTRIVFATSHDGVRVAASVIGNGFPMLHLTVPALAHCKLPNPVEGSIRFQERMASRRMRIRADLRGSGLALRNVGPIAFDDYCFDIDAILDELGVAQTDIVAISGMVPTTVRYAARNPERVRRLYLWAPTVGPNAAAGYSVLSPASRRLMADDWNLYVDTFASRSVSSEALVPSLAAFIHQAVNQHDFMAYVDCLSATDIRDDLPLVRCPTLVAEFDNDPLRDAEQSQLFASYIPGAKLAIVPNISRWEFLDQFADAIERFEERLDGGIRMPVDPEHLLSRREIEVLELLAVGRTNPEIADLLTISRSTVDRHVANIYQKANLHGRAEATRWAIAHGVVPPDAPT